MIANVDAYKRRKQKEEPNYRGVRNKKKNKKEEEVQHTRTLKS